MNVLLTHKGLSHKESETLEETAYFTKEMLNDNIAIFYSTLFGEGNDVQTYISVKHYNDFDAEELQIYWSDLLAPIQSYKIILDIFELYKEFPLKVFLEIIKDLSQGGTSAAMQSQQKHKEDIMKRIKEEIDSLKNPIIK